MRDVSLCFGVLLCRLKWHELESLGGMVLERALLLDLAVFRAA